jgi:hypothetical protein
MELPDLLVIDSLGNVLEPSSPEQRARFTKVFEEMGRICRESNVAVEIMTEPRCCPTCETSDHVRLIPSKRPPDRIMAFCHRCGGTFELRSRRQIIKVGAP